MQSSTPTVHGAEDFFNRLQSNIAQGEHLVNISRMLAQVKSNDQVIGIQHARMWGQNWVDGKELSEP